MKKDVLGVKIDDVTIDEAVEIVKNWLSKEGKHYITTPNPEIVVMAQRDKELKNSINNADLAIPDGVGLKFAGVKNTFSGTDFMEKVIGKNRDWAFTVGFLGGRGDVAKRTAECLKKKYPGLKVVFASSGGEIDSEGNSIEYSVESIEGKKQKKAESHYTLYSIPYTDLLFVAFGPPKQEKWIAKNLGKLDVKVVIGVGGAFDFLSKTVPRAPRWIRNLGFEWLFRLVIQPWRLKRQLALVEYLWLLISQR